MNINHEEKYFLHVAKDILENGIESNDRTGVGTNYLFSQKFDYDISDGKIPIWTTRKINWRNQVVELIWFIKGGTNIKYLKDRNVNIWDSWADQKGEVGPIYGKQLRNWEAINHSDYTFSDEIISPQKYYAPKSVDQLKTLIEGIKTNPESRRHIITLWNAGLHTDLQKPYLPPCHSQHIQIVINEPKKELYYQMVQRSADYLIGFCPWQHALFANIIGKLTGYHATKLSVLISNCHIYKNQFCAAQEQISRMPTGFPTLKINKELNTLEDVESSEYVDYELVNYNPQSAIKFPIAI
jgi:thymidylate synthase